MPTFDDRVQKLERTFHFIAGGLVVGILLILGFFGINKWYEIPRVIKKQLPHEITNYIKNKNPGLIERLKKFELIAAQAASAAEGSAKAAQSTANKLQDLLAKTESQSTKLRIESGKIEHGNFPSAPNPKEKRDNSHNEYERGLKGKEVKFEKPFREKPKVVVALTYLDQTVSNYRIHDVRIKAVVKEENIIKKGFKFDLVTWDNSNVHRAEFSWIAYGK